MFLRETERSFHYYILYLKITFLKTPNNENSPYIWLEIQSIGSFDEKEKCQSLAPKILDAVTKLTDVPKENIHLLLKTLERHQCVMNGVCLGKNI